MIADEEAGSVVVGRAGGRCWSRRADLWEPLRLIDAAASRSSPVAAFLRELQASGRSAATQRSYAMDLLRWFRFVWAVDVGVGPGDAGRGAGLLPVAGLRDKPTEPGRGAAEARRRRTR